MVGFVYLLGNAISCNWVVVTSFPKVSLREGILIMTNLDILLFSFFAASQMPFLDVLPLSKVARLERVGDKGFGSL